MTDVRERPPQIGSSPSSAPGDAAEALFREAQRRRHRRWFVTAIVIVVVAAVTTIVGLTEGRTTPKHLTVRPAGSRKVTTSAPASSGQDVNLDIVTGQTQTSVHLFGSSVKTARAGSPTAGLTIAFPRKGYVLGSTGGGFASVSNNLQRVLHVWSLGQGQYPAPASNPADVWLSEPYSTPARAQEFDMVETAVGPAVPIPAGSVVRGQIGQVLVLQSAQPAALLELWNPSTQTIVALLGAFDQLAMSPTSVAWTSANTVNIATAAGVVRHQLSGSAGDWATALAFAPNGSTLAIAWSPAPGSTGSLTPSVGSASTSADAFIYQHASLSVLDISSGQSLTVPNSQGTVGPVAWTSDGTRDYFAQSASRFTNVGISTYRLGDVHSERLDIPGLTLPSDFGPPSGSVFGWNR
jgi:hypothetical protein